MSAWLLQGMIVDLSGDFFIVPAKTQQLGGVIETDRHPPLSSEEGCVYNNDPLRPSHILIQVLQLWAPFRCRKSHAECNL